MWKYVIVKYDGIRPVNNVRKLELFRLKIFITRVPCVGTCVRLSLSTRVTWIEIPSRLCPWHSETLPHSCTYNHKKKNYDGTHQEVTNICDIRFSYVKFSITRASPAAPRSLTNRSDVWMLNSPPSNRARWLAAAARCAARKWIIIMPQIPLM